MSQAKRLNDKVAIITASTKGIGFAIAKKLGLNGAKVFVSSRKAEHVEQAINELRYHGIEANGTICHVDKAQDRMNLIDSALKEYCKIDILVSNAAVNPHFGDLLDVTEQQWDKLFSVNVRAAFLLSKAAIPHMEKGSSIIYVTSVAGFRPFPHMGAYGITKTALLGLTKAMAQSTAPLGIRVNAIAPGIIRTDFSRVLWDRPSGQVSLESLPDIPLGRVGEPEECAGLVAFLVSNEAAYITGETVLVTGGITARL